MAFVTGKEAVLKIDNVAGALIDVTNRTTEAKLNRSPDQLDATALGDQDKSFLAGFISGEFPLSGNWDPADDNIHDILAPAVGSAITRTVEYGPEGGTTGKVKYSAEVVVLTYEVTISVDAIITWTATCRVDGTVTRGTF